MKLDLHVHTMWSGDSTTTPDELAGAVLAASLDAICITDHNTIAGAVALAESGELGCAVIVGEEVRTVDGDLIGIGLRDRIPAGLKPLEAAALIRRQGGLVYVPHPGDARRHSLSAEAVASLAGEGLLDVVEVLNAKCAEPYTGAVHGAARAAASDAHVPAALGAAWTEIPDCDLSDPESLLSALHLGSIHGAHYDPPREWAARVVPAGLSINARG